jgi:hypothetical protein
MPPTLVAASPRAQWVRTLLVGTMLVAYFLTLGVTGADAKKPKVTVKVTGTTLVVSGTPNADVIVLALHAGEPTVLQVFAGDKLAGNVDRSRFATIRVNAAGDDDSVLIDESNGTFTIDEPTTVEGGAGADTLIGDIGGLVLDGGADADTIGGGNGADVILGGEGADTIDANQGADAVFAGSGDDVLRWDPGDGSDTLEGQDGTDTLDFHGSNIGEIIQVSANGGRALVLRDIANITMDLDDVERIDLSTLGGADTIVVNDLTGTDVSAVAVDLAGVGGVGDAAIDSVTVRGTAGDDSAGLRAAGGTAGISLGGLEVTVSEPEALDSTTFDGLGGDDSATLTGTAGPDTVGLIADGLAVRLTTDASTLVGAIAETVVVETLGGADTIGATGNIAGIGIELVLDGGADADTIGGGNGADVILGGEGADTIDANQGADAVFAGSGDDVLRWDPGDGSDTLEGQDGTDTLDFHGSNIGEIIQVSANGGRALVLRDIANITMDLDDVERIDLSTLGGADTIVVNDLTGTDVSAVAVDLAGVGGVGDAAIDSVTVRGTAGDDAITITGSGTSALVTGLHASVAISGAESANDTLSIDAGAGTDTVDASGLVAGVISLIVIGVP